VIHLPLPNPLPEGEEQELFALPSPSGRGTEGEGIRPTILAARRVLRQFHLDGRSFSSLTGKMPVLLTKRHTPVKNSIKNGEERP
jgi:hypothetical protein